MAPGAKVENFTCKEDSAPPRSGIGKGTRLNKGHFGKDLEEVGLRVLNSVRSIFSPYGRTRATLEDQRTARA